MCLFLCTESFSKNFPGFKHLWISFWLKYSYFLMIFWGSLDKFDISNWNGYFTVHGCCQYVKRYECDRIEECNKRIVWVQRVCGKKEITFINIKISENERTQIHFHRKFLNSHIVESKRENMSCIIIRFEIEKTSEIISSELCSQRSNFLFKKWTKETRPKN